MNNRYSQRYRLPESIRLAGCPVTLEVAVLLDDTKIKRQVAQLKFRAEDARAVTCVTVGVTAYDEQNFSYGTVLFTYQKLAAEQGQYFGTNVAVPVPGSDMARIGVTVLSVTLADGTVWTPTGVSHVAPPVRPAAPAAAVKPAQPKAAPQAKSVPQVQTPVPKPAEPVVVMPAPKPVAETPAPTPVSTPVEQPKAEPAAVPAQHVSPQPVFTAPASAEKTVSVTPKKSGSKKGLVIAAVAVVAVVAIAAAAFLLPKGGNSNVGSDIGLADKLAQVGKKEEEKKEVVVPEVTTPYDQGTVTLVLEVEPGKEDRCRISTELLREAMPQVLGFSNYDCWELGEDIDTYLSFSNHMMDMVYEEREKLYEDDNSWGNVWLDISGYNTVLLFSDPTTLCGYFIGRPESLGDGKWELTFTLCDYDFESLYRQRKSAFEAAGMEDLRFIKPDDVANCGAAYYYYGYSSTGNWRGYHTGQMYYLWTQMNSPYSENYRKEIDTLEKRLPTADNLFTRYFFLVDENEELIGFTVYSPQWVTGPDNSGSPVWDGSVATGFAGGSGIAQDPFIIKTAPQLAYLSQCIKEDNNNGKYFRLDADLDLKQFEWEPIGGYDRSFNGHFDGNGHTIRGLEITRPAVRVSSDGWQEATAGLFGRVHDGSIQNLTVEGSISIVQTDPNFNGSVNVGGIVGNGWRTTFYNCHNRCKITLENYASESGNTNLGGITGQCGDSGLVNSCSNSGEILLRTARYANTGGVVGSASNIRVINSWNAGSVTMESLADNTNGDCGGVMGNTYGSAIINCCNLGTVRGAQIVGGVTGYLGYYEDAEEQSRIVNCFSVGDVAYTGTSRGREAGMLTYSLNKETLITNCFYPAGTKAVSSNNPEGTVESVTAFDEVGNITMGVEHVQDALNKWVDANNQDGLYARWSITPQYASEFPIPFVD